MRLFPAPTSPIIAHRRRALIARHPVVARLIDRRELLFASTLPETRDDAADLLAELVMIHAVEQMMMLDSLDEDGAVKRALGTLFGEVLDGELLVAVALHVDEAMRRIPERFSQRLLEVAVRVWPIPAIVGAEWPMRRVVARS